MRPNEPCEANRFHGVVPRQKDRLEAQADAHVLEVDELEALQPLILDVARDAVLELRREAAASRQYD
jgi:hypothetical protein